MSQGFATGYGVDTDSNMTANSDQLVPSQKAVKTALSTKQPLDSDLTAIAGLTPANDDIIQRKAGAWTNRTVAQYYADLQASVKDDVYFVIPLFSGATSPADSTTYYIGNAGFAPTTSDTSVDFNYGFSFKVIGVVIFSSNNTISGSAENSVAQLRNVTAGTSTSMGNFQTNGSTTNCIVNTITGLNIAVGASDHICMQWDTPAYATNPTTVQVRAHLICKRS